MITHKIVSFYGAGSLKPGFYFDKNVIEALCGARTGDKNLKVLAFFGNQDQSLPSSDQTQVKQALESASISYEHHEYDASHDNAAYHDNLLCNRPHGHHRTTVLYDA